MSSGHKTASTNGSKSSPASSNAGGNAKQASMNVLELAPSYINLKTTFAISQSHRPGWHFFDVSSVIRQLLANATPTDRHLLAVSFTQKVRSSERDYLL
jgi:hypothetical protein